MNLNNLALIGIGYWGKVHLKYLREAKKVNLSKIFYKNKVKNINKRKIKKFKFTNSLKNILEDNSINFVDIVTPIETHANLALKFLKKGKNTLVEKPLIMNRLQEKNIEKLAKKMNKKITVSYPYLFSKSLLLAKKIIDSKKFGKLNYVEINIQQCGRFMKYGVNHLLAPHAISILSLFYKIDKLRLSSDTLIKKKNNKETTHIKCSSGKKILGIANLSLNYASNQNLKKISLFCNKGTIICDLNSQKKTISSYKYIRKKKDKYEIGKITSYISKYFDEQNNMKFVIEDFYSKKQNLENFILTKKINRFLKK